MTDRPITHIIPCTWPPPCSYLAANMGAWLTCDQSDKTVHHSYARLITGVGVTHNVRYTALSRSPPETATGSVLTPAKPSTRTRLRTWSWPQSRKTISWGRARHICFSAGRQEERTRRLCYCLAEREPRQKLLYLFAVPYYFRFSVLVLYGKPSRAKATTNRLREQAERLRRKRDLGARTLQGRWRSYRARQKLENLKRLLRLEEARRHAAATGIQKMVRASRCR